VTWLLVLLVAPTGASAWPAAAGAGAAPQMGVSAYRVWLPYVVRNEPMAYNGALPRPTPGPEAYRGCQDTEVRLDNGTELERTVLSYDDAGRAEHAVKTSDDGSRIRLEWHYDSMGRLVRFDYDAADDGVIDYFDLYEYDVAGRLSDQSSYSDGGEVLVSLRHHKYWTDQGGRLVERLENDGGGDGTIESAWETVTVDGQEVEQRHDSNADGRWDYVRRGVLNGDGLVERVEVDYGADGSVDRLRVLSYDVYGRVVRSEDRDPRSGTVYDSMVMAYGRDGYPLRSEKYIGGVLEYTVVQAYDRLGRIMTFATDHVAYGRFATTHHYDCRRQRGGRGAS